MGESVGAYNKKFTGYLDASCKKQDKFCTSR